jgi:hypothetical protein
MMGKGGSTTSEVKVPQYVEDAAKANLAKADLLAQIGYVPEYGPSTAAFTPMQEAAFQNTAGAAGAFGMAGGGGTGMEGMPTPTTYAGGIRGYSSAPLYEESMAELEARRPGQYAAINAPFIDPVTGASPDYPYAGSTGSAGFQPVDPYAGSTGQQLSVGGNNDGGGNPLMDETYARAKASRDSYVPTDMLNQKGGSYSPNTGYTGFGDMINGGGPRMSGDTYQGGGLLSSVGNFFGGKS